MAIPMTLKEFNQKYPRAEFGDVTVSRNWDKAVKENSNWHEEYTSGKMLVIDKGTWTYKVGGGYDEAIFLNNETEVQNLISDLLKAVRHTNVYYL